MSLTSMRGKLLHPRSWPIALKLAITVTAVALLPMLIVAQYNLQRGTEITAAGELEELEQLAASVGHQLDQLIKDTGHTISYFGWSEDVIRLASLSDSNARASVEDRMSRLLTANDDLELFMVLDRNGSVLASSKPHYVGRKLSFRDYFKEAARGKDFISDLEVGTASNSPGMYFSSPVRDASGRIAGVAVLKLKGSAITTILEDARSRQPTLTTFLIDSNGIVIHHSDERALYHSLVPLAPEVERRLIEEKRFGLESRSIPSFDVPALAEPMLRTRQRGNATYVSPLTARPEIAGFAPLRRVDWRIGVAESQEVYSAPLRKLFDDAVKSVVLVGILCVLIAVMLARTFTRPIKALAEAARAVETGELGRARLRLGRNDEFGRLAATFNSMIDGIAARQRERDIFGRMVSPEVREKLLSGELKLGGENLRVSVLFSDIRGFSTMSERMSPNDVVMLLNEYLTEMTEAVRPYGGYVNNFIGDAIVVVFGAPDARTDCEWDAICAARAMKQRLRALNARRAELGDPPLQAGIGISTGKVVAGQIGSMERFMYTVIGDAVNIAARLEALTKDFEGNPILLNAMTWQGCQQHHHEIRAVDEGLLHVKGRAQPVYVYAIHDEGDSAAVEPHAEQGVRADA